MKTCFKCGKTLPLDEFYKHPMMGDGHLNKCKDCTRADVKEAYRRNREARHEYERQRAKRPERKLAQRRYSANARKRHPEKRAARVAAGNAIRKGNLVRQPCEVCGSTEDVEAHHHDYSKPLDVVWMCRECHRKVGHNRWVG